MILNNLLGFGPHSCSRSPSDGKGVGFSSRHGVRLKHPPKTAREAGVVHAALAIRSQPLSCPFSKDTAGAELIRAVPPKG